MMEAINPLWMILFLFCLVASAFFSSSETAFISLRRVRIRHLVDSGVSGAEEVEKLTAHPEKLLATVLLGNNFVNTGAAALGTLMAVSLLGTERGAIAATIGVTLLLLVFGEIIPKTLATRMREGMALLYIHPLRAISWLLWPFTAVLARIGAGLAKLLGAPPPRELVSEEEIRTLISMGREEGVVEESEAQMVEKIFRFGDLQVGQIMSPRTEITWVEKDTTLKEFLSVYSQSPHSRFPVYEETVDNVIGILGIKDVLLAQARGELKDEDSVTRLARPAYFVPESKPIGELFEEMKSSRQPMAIVVDEYGGTAGLVTLEQLAEEIVGHLGDELARGEKKFETVDVNTYEIDAGMRVEEANEELGLNIPVGDYETVAGFILSTLGHIPREGEQLKLEGMTLTVTEMKGVKIEKVLVIRQ